MACLIMKKYGIKNLLKTDILVCFWSREGKWWKLKVDWEKIKRNTKHNSRCTI